MKEFILVGVDTETGKTEIHGSEKIEASIRKGFKALNNKGVKGQAIPMLMSIALTQHFTKKGIKPSVEFMPFEDAGLQIVYGWSANKKTIKKIVSNVFKNILKDSKAS